MCNRYITKNINNLKKTSLRVENQAIFEFKKTLKETDFVFKDIENKKLEISKKTDEIKDRLKNEENDKLRKAETKLQKINSRLKENFIPNSQKVKEVIKIETKMTRTQENITKTKKKDRNLNR